MNQQIEFSYTENKIKITDNGTRNVIEIDRSGNDIRSIERDKKELLNQLFNLQKDYSI